MKRQPHAPSSRKLVSISPKKKNTAQKLENFVNSVTFTRVKGIFRINAGWILLNRSDQQFTREDYQDSNDSRVEIIESDFHDWNQVENKLLTCIKSE